MNMQIVQHEKQWTQVEPCPDEHHPFLKSKKWWEMRYIGKMYHTFLAAGGLDTG
jgi:hypothetical protein